MRKVIFLAVATLIYLTPCLAQEARNALLIANGEYSSDIGNLETPIPEAEALKSVLDELGFTTTIVKNAGRTEILEILDEFRTKTKSEGGIAFFHYGGHAVQYNGRNYILPVDSNIPDEERLLTRAVESKEIMASMNADANIIILDSCRNSPFSDNTRGSTTRGLIATTESPKNSIIVYSAAAGCTAQDGVFTPILTKKIAEKGKSFSDVLIETRKSVHEQTNGQQQPWEYGSLTSKIYLAGRDVVTPDMFKSEDADMRIERIYANLEITSEIAGELYIDGQSYGKILAGETIVLNNIPAARYRVKVQGEEAISESVSLSGGETTRISLEKKPSELALKSTKNQKKNIFSVKDIDGYSFGIEGFYNFSWFSFGNKPVFSSDKAFGMNIFPFSMSLDKWKLKIGGGYTYSDSTVGKEVLAFHEADWLLFGVGGDFVRIAFTLGFGLSTTWEIFSYEVDGNSYKTETAKFCMPFPVSIYFRIGKNFSLFAEYKPTLFIDDLLFRHSGNVGIRLDFYYTRSM